MHDCEFTWDEKKRKLNISKHGLYFEDAVQLFDGNLLVVEDDRKDYGEPRYVGLGELEDVLVVIVFTVREPNIVRIISFRAAEDGEKEFYYGK
jgi:hypothetical protein